MLNNVSKQQHANSNFLLQFFLFSDEKPLFIEHFTLHFNIHLLYDYVIKSPPCENQHSV